MEMKKAYIYLISFFALSAAFSLCYFISYKTALNQFNKGAVEKNNELSLYAKGDGTRILDQAKQNVTSYSGEEALDTENLNATADELLAVDTNALDAISMNTICVMEEYNLIEDTLSEKYLSVPDELIGLNRSQLVVYVTNYMLDIPAEDMEKGLSAFEIVSYSPEKVVLRKTYNDDLIPYKYFIVVFDGLITVYYSDKKTVYEYTDIDIKNLPEEEQKKLNYGIDVKDQEELYGILENYSS